MVSLFEGCSSLESVNVSGLDCSQVTGAAYMFSGCSSLAELDLSGVEFSRAANLSYLFSGCSSLASLDLSGVSASKLTNAKRMFGGCSSLASLDLSGLNTSKVRDAEGMFTGCSSLVRVTLGSDFAFAGDDSALPAVDANGNPVKWRDSAGVVFDAADVPSNVADTYERVEASSEPTLSDGWTQAGGCEWRVDEGGCLTLRPLGNGESGALSERPGWSKTGATSFGIEGKVRAEGDALSSSASRA